MLARCDASIVLKCIQFMDEDDSNGIPCSPLIVGRLNLQTSWLDGSLIKTSLDRQSAFTRRVQSGFSSKTAYLMHIDKAHNLLGCLGCAA